MHFSTPLSLDLAWHVYIAREMLGGKKLYADFFEINTPFIIYYTMIAVWFGKLCSISPKSSLYIVNFVIAVISRWVCLRIVYKSNRHVVAPFISYILMLMPFIFPATEFGQKEHIFIVFAMPYFVRVALGSNASTMEVVFATLGSLIKPYFGIVLGVSFLISKKREWILVFGLVNVLHLAWIVTFHTQYISEIVPIAIDGYEPLHYQWSGVFEYMLYALRASIANAGNFIFAFLFLVIVSSRGCLHIISLVVIAFVTVLVQKKFWWYHFIPMIALSLLYSGVAIERYILRRPGGFIRYIYATAITLTLGAMFIPFEYSVQTMLKEHDVRLDEDVVNFLSEHQNETILLLSSKISAVVVLSQEYNLRWPMKQHSLQLLDGAFTKEEPSKKVIEYVMQDVSNAIMQDPKFIIVRNMQLEDLSQYSLDFFLKKGYGYVDFLSKNKVFKEKILGYKELKTSGDFTIFERR